MFTFRIESFISLDCTKHVKMDNPGVQKATSFVAQPRIHGDEYLSGKIFVKHYPFKNNKL